MSTDIIGYFAVVLPREDEYQAFYLRQEDTAEGQATLDRAVTAWRKAMGVNPTAQELRHTLAASLAEVYLARSLVGVAWCAHALRLALKADWFWVEAYPEREGTRTSIHLLAARDPDAARLEIRGLPAVRLIELNLALQKLMKGGE